MATATPLLPLTPDDRAQFDPRDDDAILTEARRRFLLARDFEHQEREQQRQALAFRAGEHQDPNWRHVESGETYPQPSLVVDRQSQYIQQITNAVRKNPLAVRVRPRGGGASQPVADILQDAIRAIEQESQADIAYQVAYDQAVGQGTGYFRLTTEYVSPWSFEQQIRVLPIFNRMTVYMDPGATMPAASNAQWAFVVDLMTRPEFAARYGRQAPRADRWGSDVQPWFQDDMVQVADYYYTTYERLTIVRLPSGQVVPRDRLQDAGRDWPTRETQVPTVWWVKMAGTTVLQKTRWLGTSIPIIRVEGDRLDVEGTPRRTGVVQHTMTSSLLYDYYTSAEGEAIALSPKSPYILAMEQIAEYRRYWDNANDAHQPYLPYKVVVVNGQVLPPPRREQVEPPIQALTLAKAGAANDIEATLGMYKSAMGQEANERSGVAVRSRKIEADEATYHFPANLAWSIREGGRQMAQLVQALHAQSPSIRTLKPDGESAETAINLPRLDAATGQSRSQEERLLLAQGDYLVVIDAGPSFSTQREMASEKLGLFAQVEPKLVPYYSDYWVRSMDIPYSQEIADRLATAVPPEARQASKPGDPRAQVAALLGQVQHLTAQTQAMQQALTESQTTAQTATQQVALLERQVADMRVRLDDDRHKNQLTAEKQAQDYDIALRKLTLEARKLALEAVPPVGPATLPGLEG